MKGKSELRDTINELHICKGYVEAKHLQLDYSTIVRAQKVGIVDVLLKIVRKFPYRFGTTSNKGKQL